MYLHIGNGKNIKKKEIIGIFDMDSATISSVTRAYIKRMDGEGKIIYEDNDIPRSFILSSKEIKSEIKGKERLKRKKYIKGKREYSLYLSKISAKSLKSRVDGDKYYEYDVSEE